MRSPLLFVAAVLVLAAISCKTSSSAQKDEKPELVTRASEGLVEDAGAPAVAEPELPQLPPAPPVPEGPKHLPAIEAPAENPLTPEKAQLGWMLFFDKRLSKDDSMACESCHHIDKAYTSGNAKDAKVGGAMNVRNAPTMLNLAYHGDGYYWDGRKPTLETVAQAAWTGQLLADAKAVAQKLNGVPAYRAHFRRAFGEDASDSNVPKALASFLRALKSGNSAYDKAEAGDAKAMSKDAKKGQEVFRKAGCGLCHIPPLFTDSTYRNAGIGSDLPEAERDHGRKDATKQDGDEGKFKTPSLRDVAKTAPYFHDGSAKTLDEAINVMAGGGKPNPLLNKGFHDAKLSKKDKAALKSFLEALSGEYSYTTAPVLP